MDPDEDRRIEADDEWLAGHRSDAMLRFQRRFRRVAGIGDAVSNAELGPFGGAPRNPKLNVGGRSYALVRYAQHRIAYTTIRVDLHRCRYCGKMLYRYSGMDINDRRDRDLRCQSFLPSLVIHLPN